MNECHMWIMDLCDTAHWKSRDGQGMDLTLIMVSSGERYYMVNMCTENVYSWCRWFHVISFC